MAHSKPGSLDWLNGHAYQQGLQIHFDQDIPVDPSIAASNPIYPSFNGQDYPYGRKNCMQCKDPQIPLKDAIHTPPPPDLTTYAREEHTMYNANPTKNTEIPAASLNPGGVYPVLVVLPNLPELE